MIFLSFNKLKALSRFSSVFFLFVATASADGILVYENFKNLGVEPKKTEIFIETGIGKITIVSGQSILIPDQGVVSGGIVEDGKQSIVVIEKDDEHKLISNVSDLKKDLISELDSQDLIRARNKAQKKVEDLKNIIKTSGDDLSKNREKAAKVVKIEDLADLKNELVGLKDSADDPRKKSLLVSNLIKEGYSDSTPINDTRGELIEQLKSLSRITASSETSSSNTHDAIIRDFERKLNLIKTTSNYEIGDLQKELSQLRQKRRQLEQ